MAMQLSSRSLLCKTLISSLLPRRLCPCPLTPSPRPPSLLRSALRLFSSADASTGNSSEVSESSIEDLYPPSSYLNIMLSYEGPPKEKTLLDDCYDWHWRVFMGNIDDSMTKDDMIDSYIKTLSKVLGSEEEARKKIYYVSTKRHFAFGALVPEELLSKLKMLPEVAFVLPESHVDLKTKYSGGDPFVNGQVVPYDHAKWLDFLIREGYYQRWFRNRVEEMSRNLGEEVLRTQLEEFSREYEERFGI